MNQKSGLGTTSGWFYDGKHFEGGAATENLMWDTLFRWYEKLDKINGFCASLLLWDSSTVTSGSSILSQRSQEKISEAFSILVQTW